MRCARGRVEGEQPWVYARTRRGCVGRGEGRGSLFFFSLHATAERIHPRAKKLYYFGGKILFRPSANPSFVSSPFSSLFFKPTTLFSGPRATPPERDRNHGGRGRETAAPFAQPRFSARLVIISRYYPACILQFCCCSRAITLAVRQINWNLELLRFVGCVFDLNFSLEMFLCFRRF